MGLILRYAAFFIFGALVGAATNRSKDNTEKEGEKKEPEGREDENVGAMLQHQSDPEPEPEPEAAENAGSAESAEEPVISKKMGGNRAVEPSASADPQVDEVVEESAEETIDEEILSVLKEDAKVIEEPAATPTEDPNESIFPGLAAKGNDDDDSLKLDGFGIIIDAGGNIVNRAYFGDALWISAEDDEKARTLAMLNDPMLRSHALGIDMEREWPSDRIGLITAILDAEEERLREMYS